jgi:SAM-dependent methyltransferase
MPDDDKPLAQDVYAVLAERYAAKIDTKPHNAFYEQPATRALLPELHGKRVLDAGCGTAIWTKYMLDHGADVVGVDSSPEMLAFGRQRVGDRATLHQADLRYPLPFLENESFDVVLSSLVFHYIKDWTTPLAEFSRVLRPGGVFIFSTGHPLYEYLWASEPHYFEVELLSMTWRGFGGDPVDVPFYRRSLGSITEALSGAGFVIERIVEPMPTEEFKRADPKDYDALMKIPEFMCIRARKDTRG